MTMPSESRRLGNWYRALTREAFRGWEPERMLYNLVLAWVVVADVWESWPALKDWFVVGDAFFHPNDAGDESQSCWRQARLRDEGRDDWMLVAIEPPLISHDN